MSSDQRYIIIVDDANPRIEYSQGGWSLWESGESTGAGGVSYNSTEHFSTSDDASFKFRFNGTSVSFYGTIDTTNNASILGWRCQIDNSTVEVRNPPSNRWSSHWTYCSKGGLSEGEHELAVQTNSSVPISLDAIRYQSLRGDDPNGDTIVLNLLDAGSGISFTGPGWQDYDANGDGSPGSKYSDKPGAKISFDFNGTAVSLMTMAMCCATNDMIYTIDGSAPIRFQMPWVDNSTVDLNNQPLLYLDGLDASTQHHLEITHNGTESGAPLLVMAGYITTPGASTLTAESSTPSPSEEPDRKTSPIGAIVGGVFGGVAALVIGLICLYYFSRGRRNKRKASQQILIAEQSPFLEPKPGMSHQESYSSQPDSGTLSIGYYDTPFSSPPGTLSSGAQSPPTQFYPPRPTSTGSVPGYTDQQHPAAQTNTQGNTENNEQMSYPSQGANVPEGLYDPPPPPPPGALLVNPYDSRQM